VPPPKSCHFNRLALNSSRSRRASPFLALQAAAFRLGDRLVFPNSSWLFRSNEHWAVIGPNGSGKSLLGDGLRGQLPLVHGELRYHFRPPHPLTHEEAIGHVSFEDRKAEVHDAVVQSRWNSLEEEDALRVRDFLSFERVMDINPFEITPPQTQARRQFSLRLQRAISVMRIGAFLDRTLFSLSNGERQRIQLARALCHPLRLLILDEPFAGLDVTGREYLHRVLDRLMETPLRVLLLTTRPEDLPRRTTHVLRVHQCRLVAAGPRRQVLDQFRGSKGASAGKVPRTGLPTGRRSATEHRKTPLRSLDAFKPRSGHVPVPLVELRNVSVAYGDAPILQSINWTIYPGESWALLGPNGSGKTTLLSLIQGDNPQAYKNHVVVFGRQRGTGESIWELKRHVGWVSPELHLHFNDTISCFQVVASGFHDTVGLFDPPNQRQRALAREWLARFGLLDFAHTPLFGLSAGAQRMVLLARALVKRPRLLLLDEPCQGLDASHRALFIRTLEERLRLADVTAVYVTHRPEEIPPSIHRVLRLTTGGTEWRSIAHGGTSPTRPGVEDGFADPE
jgi:molybdate transport system ATP-binding protein